MLPFQCRFRQVVTKCFAFSCSIRLVLRTVVAGMTGSAEFDGSDHGPVLFRIGRLHGVPQCPFKKCAADATHGHCVDLPRIRVFDLCPIVSRAHGFSQTKTDRTKKEEKTKQRTESKQRPKQRTDKKERKTIGSGTGVDKKSKEAQCFHSNAVFTKLSPNASLFPVPSVLGCAVGASTHSSVCDPKSTKFFEFHTSGMKPPL